MSDGERSSVPTGAARPGWRGCALALLALVVAPIVVFPWKFIRTGMVDGGDDLRANLPQLVYSARSLLRGELLWTDAMWMGHPLLAEPEWGMLYPPRLLLLLGPPLPAFASYVLGHYLLAELGAYAYLRELSLSRRAAVFGALAYAYTGFMLGHLGHTMYLCAGAWTPLTLLCLERSAKRGGRLYPLLAALSFAMLPFSGALQLTLYLAGVIVLLAAARAWFERRPAPLLLAGVGLIPGLLVSAAQILPAMGYAAQLATEVRHDAVFNAELSFHPALLPTLVFPASVMHAEYYSRIGVLALCGAVAAIVGWRDASPLLRSWIVVAGMSFTLMLGKFVPGLTTLLGALPVVGVFRAPVRHNYELGLALSVIAAFGVERLLEAPRASLRPWVNGGVAVAAVSWLLVSMGSRDSLVGPQAAEVVRAIRWPGALAATLCFGLWLCALGAGSGRLRRALWAAVAVTPALEAACVYRVEFPLYRDFRGLIDAAQLALPHDGRPVRLLGTLETLCRVDSFAGNSHLFHPGVQALAGYSSTAYSDVREMLDLDLFGILRSRVATPWSVLPSVFGVTHLVLPTAACGSARFQLGPGAECGADEAPHEASLGHGQLTCRQTLDDRRWHYRIETDVRAERADPTGLVLGTYGFNGRRFELDLHGDALTPAWQRRSLPVSVDELSAVVHFAASNVGITPVELRAPMLTAEVDTVLAEINPTSAGILTRAACRPEAVVLDPQGGLARAELGVSAPTGTLASSEFELALEARAPRGQSAALVVDLYAAGFDPEDAQIVVPAGTLGTEWSRQQRKVRLDAAPEHFALRAFVEGDSPVELRFARLSTPGREIASRFPVTTTPVMNDVTISGSQLRFEPGAKVGGKLSLPLRTFEVRLDLSTTEPLDGPVYFGLARDRDALDDFIWRRVQPDEIGGRRVLGAMMQLAPDAPHADLIVRNDGAAPIVIHSLTARDACTLREYGPATPLANGLSLYENPHALPRAYTVGEVRPVSDVKNARQALLSLATAQLGKLATIESSAVPDGLRQGVVEATAFGPRRAQIDVLSKGGPTLLVVNDRFDADWGASIDGAPAPILRANGIVRGVWVPAGSHRVLFEYVTPGHVWLGAGLALAGLLLAVFGAPGLRRRVLAGAQPVSAPPG